MGKIILLSDFHEAPFKEVKFESQERSFGEDIIQILSGLKKKRRVFKKMVQLVKMTEFVSAIHNGDLIESRCTERGMKEVDDLEAVIKAIISLERALKCKVKCNIGNHETGYRELPLVTDSRAGISKKSISNALKALERDNLYHSFEEKGYLFVFLPYIFMEKEAVDFDVGEEKQCLLDKLKKDLERDLPVILFLHDPDALCHQPLSDLMRANRKNIKKVFCGHYHAQETVMIFNLLITIFKSFCFAWVMGLISWLLLIAFKNLRMVFEIRKYFFSRRRLPALMKEFDVIVIPAPGGMMGIGGGFLVLDLEDLSVQKYS